MTATIARLKITLDDMEPAVIRRVETSFDIRLDRLHLLVQAAMGWTNSHLYETRAGDVGWGMPDPGCLVPSTGLRELPGDPRGVGSAVHPNKDEPDPPSRFNHKVPEQASQFCESD